MPRRIMIVDDVATNRILLKARLASAYHDAVLAGSGAEALAIARANPPDLFVIDYHMPGMDGIALCRSIRADAALAASPVIMVSADGSNGTKLAALAAGADDFLPKPVGDRILLARIRALLRHRETTLEYGEHLGALDALGLADGVARFDGPASLALIAADRPGAVRWRAALAAHLPHRVEVLTFAEALAGTAPLPDLLVLVIDPAAPAEALQLMSELRSRPETRHAAVCIAVPAEAASLAATALDMGADDVFALPFDGQEVALRARMLIARKRQADRQREQLASGWRMALTDPLTGLHNRRHALPALARMMAEAQPCAVMVIDVDRFKSVNDTHGHAAGDAVLVAIARRLSACTRPGDLVARIGGEEFLLALPATTGAEARTIAERLCSAMAQETVTLQSGEQVGITVSIGLAVSTGANDNPDRVVHAADQALMAAKGGGRNRVVALARRSAA